MPTTHDNRNLRNQHLLHAVEQTTGKPIRVGITLDELATIIKAEKLKVVKEFKFAIHGEHNYPFDVSFEQRVNAALVDIEEKYS